MGFARHDILVIIQFPLQYDFLLHTVAIVKEHLVVLIKMARHFNPTSVSLTNVQ